ncbi:MAG: PTS sugar transporter subunit IIA [Candidatus Omnitrophica bacterium]|nr:PTS sugar transporter subunit IIA [Candidatus Omnitrophota bacterium]
MKITDFLNVNAISADLKATNKEEVIKELVDLLDKAEPIKAKDALTKRLMEREALGSTGIGQGIGIPHAKCNAVKELTGALSISHKGVDFDSLDGEPTYIFFLLVAPEDAAGPHLKALATISRMLKNRFFRESLISAKDTDTILNIITKENPKT